ncbi:MAG: hypothetical protein OEY14_18010, partial [Myxococcales bacterium]|nr:hypothetical protein [Myxococcales bacterium]
SIGTIGGYGELHLELAMPEGGEREARVDLHRLVLFVAHHLSETMRFYTELEVEHALLGEGLPGELGIEQAYVEWDWLGSALRLRVGMLLIPMGIVNQWHEPPIFHGVERPRVDRIVIPSTWREAGVGIIGEPSEGLRYELYLTSGLDISGMSGASGLRGGRQSVAKAITNGPAIAARLEMEPALGLVFGASAYLGWAGMNTAAIDGPGLIFGAAADARMRRRGLELRGLIAFFSIGDTDQLRRVPPGATGVVSDVGSAILGGYAELAYDVLFSLETEHALLPFFRFEWYDTTLGEEDPSYDQPSGIDAVFGLSYRPAPQLVLKTDLIIRRPSEGAGSRHFALGVGWMF